jgi:tRNA(Ile)-lysidine synthase
VAALPDALKRRLVRHLLQRRDCQRRAPNLRTVDNVLRFLSDRSKGTRLSLRGADVIREQETVLVVRRDGQEAAARSAREQVATVRVSIPSVVYWPGSAQQIHVQEMTKPEAEPLLKHRTRDCAVFDMARFSTPLLLRPWKAGDRLHPRGMSGKSKKLQDLFTDLKLGREERSRIPLLVAPEGILWVVGRREDERFVARKGTSRCLVATVDSSTERKGAG